MKPFTKRVQLLPFLAVLGLAACNTLNGSGLKPGQGTLADIERALGKPALRWENKDGSLQLAYSKQGGPSNLMVTVGTDGKLQTIHNALEPSNFEKIHAGMSKEEVLRILGPSDPTQKIRFPRRNELAMSWVFQDNNDLSYFIVLFDAEKEIVRTSLIVPFRVVAELH